MQAADTKTPNEGPMLEAYWLGEVDYESCLELQHRLVYEVSGRDDGQMVALFCEHAPLVTIGRQGSRAHLRLEDEELASHRLQVKWVNRGGGCLMHVPGQLAVYPIVPLFAQRWTVGEYLDRLQRAILAMLEELAVTVQPRSGSHDIWSRQGLVASLGVAVKQWTSYHGAYINVAPSMHLFPYLSSDASGGTQISSLSAERQQPVRMARVRETLLRHLLQSFDCRGHHLYTRHPLLRSRTPST